MSGDPSYSLIRAVRDGNVETAKSLIESFGLSHSRAWSSGYNLLRDALQYEHEDVTKLLLRSGAKVNSKSKRPSETPLHFAVKNGYTEIISMLLDRDANINARDHSDDTPLHCAIERSSPEIVKLLLEHKAGIDRRSSNGMNALHRAVKIGNLPIVEELLNYGAPVNAGFTLSWKNGYTALHCAAAQGNEPMVKLLLSKGADINATARDKTTPLHAAMDKCREKIVKLLLERGAKIDTRDRNGKTVLHLAVEKAHWATIEQILNFRPDVNNEANRSSFYAAINAPRCDKMRKIVEALFRYGFNVRAEDAKDARLLHNAVERGYIKIVEALLKLGADVNTVHSAKGVTLLHSAAVYRQYEVAKMLLSHGANVNAKDDMRKLAICYAIENNDASMTKLLLSGSSTVKVTTELLHTGVKKESREIVEILLQLAPNIDINARDKLGRTALHHTALNEGWDFSPMVFVPAKKGAAPNEEPADPRAEMAKMFLSRGARVNAKAKNGTTALHSAAESGYAKVVEVLLENKADVDSPAEHRATPLHSAAKKNNTAIVKMLLDGGANVNARQNNGTTALHTASKCGNDDVASLLIERGADIDAKDNFISSPLHLATINGYSDVAQTLLKLGANVEAKDKLGRTALHVAAKHGWPLVAVVLLGYGADVNVVCNEGMTPLDYATLGTSEHNTRHDERLFSRRFEHDFEDDDYFDIYPHVDDLFSDEDQDDFYDYFADDYDSVSDCPCEEVAEILEQHIVAMRALDLHVSEKNLRAIDLQDEHRDILEDCQLEIAKMKAQKIGDSYVSFHDILTRNMHQLAVYARNESIVRALEKEDFHMAFPSYFRMIVTRFKRGQEREKLLSESLKAINALSGYVLPDLSAIELFNYLSNSDLENLIKADPSVEDCDS